jgi:hypothetical protein
LGKKGQEMFGITPFGWFIVIGPGVRLTLATVRG